MSKNIRTYNLKNTIWFISHPYTGDIEKNLTECIEKCNKLLDLGYTIFSPITHSHPLHLEKKRDSNFWYHQDLELLKRFDGIIMCGDWRNSKGCNMEYERARKLGLIIKNYGELVEK